MAVHKVLLYYVFTPLSDPDAVRLWQRDLCESLGLGGRIILSQDGMNGTVGGDIAAVKKYLRKTREYPAFKNMDVKWSDGNGGDFPRLSVRVREELVSFGAPGELKVDAGGVVGGGAHLSPSALHDLMAQRDVTFFDGRNAVEAEIGRFRDAVVPDVDTTRDFVAELDSGKYDHLKDSPVVTYCTGGIRCEVLSSLMITRGFSEVYQLDGGIARYGEEFKDAGLWEGSLYVFDGREAVTFSDTAAVISGCRACGTPSARLQNCCDSACREQFVICEVCSAELHFCADHAAAQPA